MLRVAEQYFMAVARAGSFTRAAEELFVSQPAVSRRIAALEKELGFSLLRRDTHSVQLTERGKLIYMALQEGERVWEKAVNSALQMKEETSRALRLGMLSGWSMHRPPMTTILDFHQRHPEMDLSIHQFNYVELTQQLLEQKLDLILTLRSELEGQQSLVWRHAFAEPLVLYLSTSHPLSREETISERFAGMPLFIMDREASISSMDNIFEVVNENGWGLVPHPMPNIDSIFTAVEQGLGCAIAFPSSRACDNPAFRIFPVLDNARQGIQGGELVFAWNVANYSANIHIFLEEFDAMRTREQREG